MYVCMCTWVLIYLFFAYFFVEVAVPVANGRSQARGRIGATAASLRHGHSNMGSEPHLRPTLQLTAMLDP